MALSRKAILAISAGVVALLVIIVATRMVGTYNDFVTERQAVETQGRQVDVQYQRSFSLLPQITLLAQEYLRNESAVQTQVAALRSGACPSAASSTGTFAAKDQCQQQLEAANSLIIKVANENYPDLKSVQLYKDVTTETINTANKVATEKGRYNELSGVYNAHVQKCCIPVLVAKWFGFAKAEQIGYTDRPNQSQFGNHTL